MNYEDFEKAVLSYLKFADKSKGINEIVEESGMSKKDKKENQEFLARMEEEGKIVKVRGEKYVHIEKSGYISGKLEIVRGKFGFVETPTESLFVLKSNMSNAFSGDIVLAKIIDEGDKNRKREAEVIKVVKRTKDKIVGVFKNNGAFGFVIPTESFGKDVYIANKKTNRAKDGELVVVEIIDWGNEDKKPEGEIIEIIGNPSDSNNLIKALLKKSGFSETFPQEVNEEASKISEVIPEKEVQKRKDLRRYPIITIDGDDAKDFDDAVYVEKTDDGNYKLLVSIADVSYFIVEDSLLEKEAYGRGNSVYLVDRVLPMFPEAISNGVCSLKEKVDRLTFTAEIEYDEKGKILGTDFYKSIINSKHRMTYSNVNKILEGNLEIRKKYSDIIDSISIMKELADIIRETRMKKGSLDFDIAETKVVLDENGKVARIEERERGPAEKLIEDFMIAANEAVAEKLFWAEIPSIYRIHEKPDVEKIKFLNEFLSKFGYKIHRIDEVHPGKFQKILEEIKDKDYKMLLNKMILMSLKQAKYSIENKGHFGLASECYTHFTSPIRRYSDLVVHRILDNAINNKTIKNKKKWESYLEKAAENTSSLERAAMEAEEESKKIKIVEYMKENIGEIYECRVSGFSKNSIFLETKEYVECYMSIVDLKGDFYFDEKSYKVLEKKSNREYTMGSVVKVQIVRVNIIQQSIEAVPYIEKKKKENSDTY